MKYLVLLPFILLLYCSTMFGQNVIRVSNCKNELITKQVDSIKSAFASQGFIIAKEASITMESEYEMAVMVALTEGSWYQFIFIGDIGSKLYEVRMFDSDEKQVVYQKKMWGDVDGNVISFSYIPKFSEYYAFRPVQVNKKKKELCGYVMLMKKVKS